MDPCAIPECEASAVPSSSRCWGHLTDAEFTTERRGSGPVEAARTTITGERAADLVRRAREHWGDRVDLTSATIDGDLSLADLLLTADIVLSGARVAGTLTLSAVSGLDHLKLGSAGGAPTTVEKLVVTGSGGESDALAIDGLVCGEVTLSGLTAAELDLRNVAWTTLEADLVRVAGSVTLVDSAGTSAKLDNCRFGSWVELRAASSLELLRCDFEGPVELSWVPPDHLALCAAGVRPEHETTLVLKDVRFVSNANLRWGRGDVSLDGTIFTEASTLGRAPGATERPRLTSAESLVGKLLRMDDARIAGCRLVPATSLGPIEPSRLAHGWGEKGWTRRRYLRDEADWKERSDPHRTLFASSLAATYRDLRVSSEAIGNHAAANDLHYGERLWQRRAAWWEWRANWFWLTAYSLVGYGVRPWRPLAWLVILVLAAGAILSSTGLERQRSLDGAAADSVATICANADEPMNADRRQTVTCPVEGWDAVEFAARSTTGLLRAPIGYETQGAAAWVEIATRLLSALLFALFVLAVRNRVRR